MKAASDQIVELKASLERSGVEVSDSSLTRELYSSDASLYRVRPRLVAFPRSIDQVLAVLEACRISEVPLTTRGAGTSIAGNAIGTGVVIDLSRHLDRIHEIDTEAKTARVEPGVVQASLQNAAGVHGLRFGPDPSTSNRCTIGGMIGNNACGSRALAYGRTSDNVIAIDFVAGNGERMTLDPSTQSDPSKSPTLQLLQGAVEPHHETIRSEFGRFARQVSGYALEMLLPEHGFDVARSVVGSEGTLGLVLGATLRLVSDPPMRALVALGYPGMADAADAVVAILQHRPSACEGLDARIVNAVRAQRGSSRVPQLPEGSGWLLVEVTGTTESEVQEAANKVVVDAGALDYVVVTDVGEAAALWRIREDGAGLSGRTSAGRPAYSGWEDAAVPPQHLGSYLRDFDKLMGSHCITGMPYGHFGDGCVHVRLDFPLTSPNGAAKMRAFLTEAAHLVVSYGGSLSGEHGDGRARSEFLKMMYSPAALALFDQVKSVFDPQGLLNPGVLTDPIPLDADLRAPHARPVRGLALALHQDDGDLSGAVHRCTGVGKCRADITGTTGVMCPSFLATRDEKDSTRGRARVLQEMVDASPNDPKWRSATVHEALDLCLMCKGCARDCPTGIDMASYKAEVLYQSYRRRLRPRSHYSLGWLPRWSGMASKVPRLANTLMSTAGLKHAMRFVAGVDQRRDLPRFATQTFRRWFGQHQPLVGGAPVALWVDTFTDYFSPHVGIAAVEVLEDAGYTVSIADRQVCCGLTWISTGQLDGAKKILRRSLGHLSRFIDSDVPIVGLEPSCTAVLRGDALELLHGSNEDVALAGRVAGSTHTLAELLSKTDGWKMPDLSGSNVVAQPHCHQVAVMGWDVDSELLRSAGAKVTRVGGCCGLAGNFGVERGHYEVSLDIASHDLLPAVESAVTGSQVLADGFSCRTQLMDLASKSGVHLAELLADAIRSGSSIEQS